MAVKFEKDTIIGDVIDYDVDAGEFFLEIGMHCLTCPVSRNETIEEACEVHGTDADALIEKLNKYFAEQK